MNSIFSLLTPDSDRSFLVSHRSTDRFHLSRNDQTPANTASGSSWFPMANCGPRTSIAFLLAVAVATVLFAGCSFLKPATSTARFFVLTPLASTGSVAAASSAPLALGVGKVKLPDYLFNTSLAIRKGASEIEYSPSILWAERLDTGFQRVLAANLANVLATDRVQLSTWQRAAVSAEVYVTIEQFDVDSAGRGVLVARWRLLAPGGDKTLAAGETRLTRAGPPPGSDPAGAVATLSGLLEEMSRQLAQTIRSAGALPDAVSK